MLDDIYWILFEFSSNKKQVDRTQKNKFICGPDYNMDEMKVILRTSSFERANINPRPGMILLYGLELSPTGSLASFLHKYSHNKDQHLCKLLNEKVSLFLWKI